MNKILCIPMTWRGHPPTLMSVAGVMYRHIALKASVRKMINVSFHYTDWQRKPKPHLITVLFHHFKNSYVLMINDVKFTDEFDGVYFSNWSERENVYPQFPDFFVQSLHIFLLPFLRFLIDFKSDKLFNTKI